MNRSRSSRGVIRHLRHAPLSLLAASVCTAAVFATPAVSQGTYVNYEVGAVTPIALQKFIFGAFTRDVLMVCNTANDQLEFYDANGMVFLDAIPTGLAPVTVRWNAAMSQAYTCNALGDSVTCINVAVTGQSGGQVQLDFDLQATYPVGDEPQDIVFVPGTNHAMVTLRSRSAVSRINLVTQTILNARTILADETSGAALKPALKNPRSIAMVGNDRVYVLDHQSDGQDTDMSLLYVQGPVGGSPNPLYGPPGPRSDIRDIGTTHANMVMRNDGNQMFIVGMKAVPEKASREEDVGDLNTGFVQSWLWVAATTGAPNVALESIGNGATFQSINLNRDYSSLGSLIELDPAEALAQPTGLALVESGNVVQKIIVTAFSSDNVAMLVPDGSEDNGWKITRLDLGILGSYSMAGPRDVVVNDAGTRAYVYCSMDNSLRTLDISGTTPQLLSSASLEFDDTPANIRMGREFLYASKHSGNNMVSCSSCHIDGHTDGIAWELNQLDQGTIPPELQNSDTLPMSWIPAKGPLTTQTLRGLVNHDVPGNPQEIFTNAPYHWRGDRESFQAFNGAFVDLMNRPMGELVGSDIDAYTEFIETMNHPPNPEQALDRRLKGGLGGSPNDPNVGTSQKRGLKIFHAHPFPISCAHCHVLPEGSGNRITQTFNNRPNHAVEPAALRHIFDRESIVVLGDAPGSASQHRVKKFGLFHDGLMNENQGGESINHFSGRFPMSANDPMMHGQQQQDLSNFVRSLDTGTAPAIGYVYTMTGVQGPDLVELRFFLDQVGEANIGWVAHTTIGSTPASHWFDLVSGSFKDDLTSGTMSLLDVLNHAGNNELVVLQAVPVGSARRIADYGRLGLEDSGSSPTNVTMQPMTPPTQWEDAGGLVSMWDPANPLVNFPTGPVATGMNIRESHERMIYMQQALLDANTNNGFKTGIDSKKHEIPRRFRVSGDNIRHGALLTIFMPTGTGTERLTMQLYPTKYTNGKNGPRVWETTVAADGEMTLAFLNGGYYHPPVNDLLLFVDPLPMLDPTNDNDYTWVVSNTDATIFVGNSKLTVRHDRQ